MIRIALIGCGAHSEHSHAKPLARFVEQHPGEVKLAAACDLDIERARRFCREYGFAAAATNLEEILREVKPDAVLGIVPIDQTAAVGTVLLERRIPCLIEKPPGSSLMEVRALAQVAQRTSGPHMVSMNRRFSPFLARAAGWAMSAGPLRCVRARMARHARTEPEFLWGTGIHVVDAVCGLCGNLTNSHVEPIRASSARWHVVRLDFESGCTADIDILPTSGIVDEVFDLFGEGFHAQARTMGAMGESARLWTNNRLEEESRADHNAPVYMRDGSYEEMSAFIRAVSGGSGFWPTLQDVLPALEVCA